MSGFVGEVWNDPTLLGLAAVITALSGVVSTIVGTRRARREAREKAEEECLQRLKKTRAEAEAVAAELHELKMRRD